MTLIASILLHSWLLFTASADTLEVPQVPIYEDTLTTVRLDTLELPGLPEEEPERPQPRIVPMEVSLNPGFQKVFGDSLLRWEQWYNLAERKQANRGAISYRLGAHGRNDAIIYRAHEPRHQLFLYEGIPLNDPVSGTMNSNMLPLDRMRNFTQNTHGVRYISEYTLNRFYVNKPLTWINFEDTRNNYRRAEVILTQNISRRGNIELAYRGNNDDGEYRRAELDGRQATVRYTHYISSNWTAQGMLTYNNYQLQESDGYQIEDPLFFNFEPLQVSPLLSSASSSLRNTLVTASFYHRPDTLSPQQSRIHLYHQRNRRVFNDIDLREFHRTLSYGIYADTRLSAGSFTLQPLFHAKATVLDDDSNTLINRSAWTEASAGVRLEFEPAPLVRLTGWGTGGYRSDSQTGYDIGYRIDLNPLRSLRLYQSLSIGEVMPTIQQLYWFSNVFNGNPDLSNEQIIRAEGGMEWSRGWISALGLKGYGSFISSPIVMHAGSGQFRNIPSYATIGAEAYAEIETHFVEAGISATVHQYESSSTRNENLFLADSGIRNSNRAYVYLKNYFFDFATFAKIGASFTFSPNAYFSSSYYSRLDYWDPLSADAPVPSYYRLDLEASARVRTVMMLFKYENVLDGVGQAGYFETSRYPMPPRRFRIGIRWILRN